MPVVKCTIGDDNIWCLIMTLMLVWSSLIRFLWSQHQYWQLAGWLPNTLLLLSNFLGVANQMIFLLFSRMLLGFWWSNIVDFISILRWMNVIDCIIVSLAIMVFIRSFRNDSTTKNIEPSLGFGGLLAIILPAYSFLVAVLLGLFADLTFT